MTDAPELEELARQYLDLWQDQWTALAADPTVAEAMARGFRMMGPGAAAFANFAGLLAQSNLYAASLNDAPSPFAANPFAAGMQGQGEARGAANNNNDAQRQPAGRKAAHDSSSSSAPAGTAPAGRASAGSDGDMAQLFDRLASLEQRLADLASALERPGGKAAPADRDTGTGGSSR